MLIRVILTCDVTGNEMAPRHLLLAILSATPESNSARFRADSTRHKFPRSPTQKVGFKNKPRKYAVWEFPMNNRLRIACTGLVLAATQAFPALADPITIIDHENRTVTLEKSADRIASIPISELEKHRIASLKPPKEMTLLRLDKNLCSRAGIDTDVIMSSRQDEARQLSQTLFDQIPSAEGILYPSRFRNNDICLATYIKAGTTPPFDIADDIPLIKHPMLKAVLIELDITIDEDR